MHVFRKMLKPNSPQFHVFIADFMYFVALVAPIMTIPQVLEIWSHHQAAGVSLSTWAAYAIVSFIWGIYGTIHKDKPLMLAQFSLFVLNTIVVIGIILYK